jgi:YidC/Oxa1 family membrane protein insertase
MEASTRKILFPMIIAFVACLVVTAVILGPGRPVEEPKKTAAPPAEVLAEVQGGLPVAAEEPSSEAAAAPAVIEEVLTKLPPLPEREGGWGRLVPRAPDGTLAERGSVSSLGSLDPDQERMRIDFSAQSAGIARITFSDFWRTGNAKRQAQSHYSAVASGSEDPPPLPDLDLLYVLDSSGKLYSDTGAAVETPILAVRSIRITGWGDTPQDVVLFGDVWSEVEPGVFRTELVEEGTDQAAFTIVRRFILPEGGYDISLEQGVVNHTDRAVQVQWIQYGPGDLAQDETTYLQDMRRFHFGYLMNTTRDPSQSHVLYSGMMLERRTAVDMAESYATDPVENMLWPTEAAREDGFSLSWFGSTNRYFALCIHAPYDPPADPSKRLTSFKSISPLAFGFDDEQNLETQLLGRNQSLEPGQEANWDIGVYAGPLERSILDSSEPYIGLNMGGLILYLMSGCCSFCTFAWLADFMVIFLSFIHGYVFDWGISIICLVIVVRALLHPITRKGQISMQKNAKAMGDMKPELDELKKRYANDPEKQRKEQMRLMQEKGMNPLGCGGAMLPMFLQMPIWIALYAVLFFAFELRQEWAFYGFFQSFDGWAFMGDLSAPDNFIKFPGEPYDLWFFQFSGINLLPLLMGLVFFFQQKYMTPPPSASMTEDQLRQQKMMKMMMLILFPIMLYGAPSGLTLYILTSSIIGTLESRYIRGHIKKIQEREENEPDVIDDVSGPAADRKKKKQDRVGKMYEQMLENARKRQEAKNQKKKSFKKR